jgi:nicotinamide-nucleotide amidase
MTIEQLAKTVGEQFKSRNWKLVTAESCTGGGLAYAITCIAGSSTWFDRGFITYSNISKEELLGVTPATLTTTGSVSAETAREMAEGALARSHAHISIALTGIAGPDGGTLEKPIGTVWIACATALTPTQISRYLFAGERETIREKTIEAALRILVECQS